MLPVLQAANKMNERAKRKFEELKLAFDAVEEELLEERARLNYWLGYWKGQIESTAWLLTCNEVYE